MVKPQWLFGKCHVSLTLSGSIEKQLIPAYTLTTYERVIVSFLKCFPAIVHGDLTTGRSPMGGEFDFSKSQIPTESPSMSGRGEVGDNIDRCIIHFRKMLKMITWCHRVTLETQVTDVTQSHN